MEYHLKVTKQEENPHYKDQHAEYENEKNNPYRGNLNRTPPSKTITVGTLEVVLTEKQFEAVRKGVLETFN